MSAAEHRIVPVEGADLNISIRGTGPTCLVLCAIGSEPTRRMMPPELAERLRLVFVDLRGSGRSGGDPTDLTFDSLAADLDAVRSALGVERVVLFGHSVLGVLALEAARRLEETVSHVVLVGTPPSGDMQSLAARSSAHFEEHGSEERKRQLEQNLENLPVDASMAATMHAQVPMRFYDFTADSAPLFEGADSELALLGHVMAKLTPDWTVEAHGSLPVPTLLALGRHDYVVPHVLWEGIAEHLSNLTVEVFERSGHQPFFEEPSVFGEAVSRWMTASD